LINPEPTPLTSLEQNTQVAKSLEFTIIKTKSHKAKFEAIKMKNPMFITPFRPKSLIAASIYFEANRAPAVYPVKTTPTSK